MPRLRFSLVFLLLLSNPAACASSAGGEGAASGIVGLASWYGPGLHGRPTASGARFDQNALTAAHRSLPFGTRVEVTNLENDRRVVVTINDRGPARKDRIIDLSRQAASRIDMLRRGIVEVRLRVLLRGS